MPVDDEVISERITWRRKGLLVVGTNEFICLHFYAGDEFEVSFRFEATEDEAFDTADAITRVLERLKDRKAKHESTLFVDSSHALQ